jgi:hypothetical protein
MSPSREKIETEIRKIKQLLSDLKGASTAEQTTTYIYYTGYATSENHLLLSDGSTLDMTPLILDFLSIYATEVLVFQDCMTTDANFG